MKRHLVTAKVQCQKCVRVAVVRCSDTEPDTLQRARWQLRQLAWRCPYCDHVNNAQADLFGGEHTPPAMTLEQARSLRMGANQGPRLTTQVRGTPSRGPLAGKQRVA